MRLLFFASDAFALPALEAVRRSRHTLAGVITTPDRKKGRGLQTLPAPPKSWAAAQGIPVWDWESPNDLKALAHLRSFNADAAVVASYGRMLSEEVLSLFKHGCLNIHPSLLPLYRGASPVSESILRGDHTVGVTIIRLVKAMDAGDIFEQKTLELSGREGAAEVRDRLAREGAGMMVGVLDGLESGTAASPRPQEHARASYCRKFTKEDGRIRWSLSAEEIGRRVRALEGWPGSFCFYQGKRVAVIRAADEASEAGVPGTICRIDAVRGIGAAAGSGLLWLERVRPEGGREMAARDFANGYRIPIGEKFE